MGDVPPAAEIKGGGRGLPRRAGRACLAPWIMEDHQLIVIQSKRNTALSLAFLQEYKTEMMKLNHLSGGRALLRCFPA
jgi:hypothetical protein